MEEEFDFDKIRLPPEMERGRLPRPTPVDRFKSASKTESKKIKDANRHIGCPFWWFKLALAAVKSKDQLAVALYIYRLSVIKKSTTVKVSNEWLQEHLGIGRGAKYLALKYLAAAGMISYEMCSGNAALVTILKRS